ncbi:hypothetical protein ACIQWZ_18815 [Streptomyces sp. NPDC098077]|uniref:hypothetical protein n=1 Tax=Streptomyces sp. NPDC098077 TaxID=3366093 RepID=UPI00380A933F
MNRPRVTTPAAEGVLAADTACVIHQHAHVSGIDPLSLAALNILALTAGFTGSAKAGIAWIGARPKPSSTQPLDRELDQTTRQRARTRPYLAAVADLPGGRALTEHHWPRREQALAAYAALLSGPGHRPDTALNQLLQAHLRLALDSPADRATAWRLARSAARAHLATAGDGPPRRSENNQTHRRDRGGSEADPQPTTSLSPSTCGDCGPDEPGLRHTPPHN